MPSIPKRIRRHMSPLKNFIVLTIAAVVFAPSSAFAQSTVKPRHFSIEDNSRFRELRDPQPSPDGKWVAYTMRTVDAAKDKTNTNLWISRVSGNQHVQLTFSGDVKGAARWRPDGRKLTFLASRGTDEEKKLPAQVWWLDLNGGEAEKLTDVKGGVSDYAWSPDGKQLALAVDDFDPASEPEKLTGWQRKAKPPIVIDRYQFKQDREGYLGKLRTHLFLFDLETRKATPLTSGGYTESAPSWSPDGKRLAFLSKRGETPDADPDRSSVSTLFVVAANASVGAQATPVAVAIATATTNTAAKPAWSPDGKWLAFLKGDEVKLSAYQRHRLAIVASNGGTVRVLTEALDRGVQPNFAWTADNKSLVFAVDDDGASYLARLAIDSQTTNRPPPEKLVSGRRTISAVSMGAGGTISYLSATAKTAAEVFVFDGVAERRITTHNDAWLAELKLGATVDFASRSKDGTDVHGLMTLPPDYVKGARYPTLLLIHGGPNGQDGHRFESGTAALRELLAARGYVVLQVNYRGSSGRGDAFQKAIFADWGNKEVIDLLGAVDWAVASGIADPNRLGLGGWSYGGILTNYTIAQDNRFKAAVSGASSSNQMSMYGTDQYILQYEREIGSPWKVPELWMKLSYPFFQADRIKTPTLFLSGEKDFNVPTAGAEQMYQALKVLNIDTQLVIYPGQFHGIAIPSYQRDVQERYLNWFDRYLKPSAAASQ
jgi:dipeptidyl aminopeptidase/acylaminoacyl peptidase